MRKVADRLGHSPRRRLLDIDQLVIQVACFRFPLLQFFLKFLRLLDERAKLLEFFKLCSQRH